MSLFQIPEKNKSSVIQSPELRSNFFSLISLGFYDVRVIKLLDGESQSMKQALLGC
ncbi:unnamed protein product [Paramecium octaurelia]|uniref:Uncharacterized protein n=1 Tax=Paramecium octaurelia TaxID=43137 RepID=A0A8S1XIC0_PAROT|nr:unnamed protein product [Paramecium octaurelia]